MRSSSGYSSFVLAQKFFLHYFQSKTIYKAHSPFLFDYFSEIIHPSKTKQIKEVETLRKDLLCDHTILDVQDFGAGSRVLKKGKRKISDIAKSALMPPKFASLYAQTALFLNARTILELGTSFGLTTSYLAKINHTANVYSIEADPSIYRQSQKNFKVLKAKNIKGFNGLFEKYVPDVLGQLDAIDFAIIDGNHTYKATMRNFNLMVSKISYKGAIVIDDIHWSSEMSQAWNQIIQDQRVRLSINFFYSGIVFFNTDLSKEDVKIFY